MTKRILPLAPDPVNPGKMISLPVIDMSEILAYGASLDKDMVATDALEMLAVWAAMVITIHPSTRDLLERYFNSFLDGCLLAADKEDSRGIQ